MYVYACMPVYVCDSMYVTVCMWYIYIYIHICILYIYIYMSQCVNVCECVPKTSTGWYGLECYETNRVGGSPYDIRVSSQPGGSLVTWKLYMSLDPRFQEQRQSGNLESWMQTSAFQEKRKSVKLKPKIQDSSQRFSGKIEAWIQEFNQQNLGTRLIFGPSKVTKIFPEDLEHFNRKITNISTQLGYGDLQATGRLLKIPKTYFRLVVDLPLWKICVRQLGWVSPTYGKVKNVPDHQNIF